MPKGPVDYDSGQRTLWQDACLSCLLWTECGGASTADCRLCSGDGDPCRDAGIICRACGEYVIDEIRPLGSVNPRSIFPSGGLSLVIPMRTGSLAAGTHLQAPWAAVRLHELISRHKHNPVRPRPHIHGRGALRETLRVSQTTRLIGVLDAKDERLEQFWEMDRLELLQQLRASGVDALTGPTFSVAEEGDLRPAFHNVTMVGRHHQSWQECENSGIPVAPNIYWRNLADRERWGDWLRKHPSVNTVFREFGAVRRSLRQFEKDLGDFVSLLESVGRPLHVLLKGIAEHNGKKALTMISRLGCGVSVLSPRPIILGTKHQKLVRDSGRLLSIPSDLSPSRLAGHNLALLEEYLGQMLRTDRPSPNPADGEVHTHTAGVASTSLASLAVRRSRSAKRNS